MEPKFPHIRKCPLEKIVIEVFICIIVLSCTVTGFFFKKLMYFKSQCGNWQQWSKYV